MINTFLRNDGTLQYVMIRFHRQSSQKGYLYGTAQFRDLSTNKLSPYKLKFSVPDFKEYSDLHAWMTDRIDLYKELAFN